MDRLCLISGSFGHSLGCPAGGRGKKDAHAFAVKKADHRIDSCRFTCSRSSCQNEQSVFNRLDHCSVLHGVKLDLFCLLHFREPPFHHVLRHVTVDIKIMEHFGCIEFQIIIMSRIDPYLSILFFHHSLLLNTKIHDMLLYVMDLHSEKRSRSPHQDLLRQEHMPFTDCLLQSIKQSALDPVIRICMYADTRCDLICCLEPYAFDIVSKLIWIFLKRFVYTHTVILINLCRKLC